MEKAFIYTVVIILLLAVVAAFSFGLGALVMVLWNWLVPAIFGLGTITFWQGWGLLVLTSLLFRSRMGDSVNNSWKETKENLKRELNMKK
jgi:hypothetical protein